MVEGCVVTHATKGGAVDGYPLPPHTTHSSKQPAIARYCLTSKTLSACHFLLLPAAACYSPLQPHL